REAPGQAGVILEQPGDLRVAGQTSIDDSPEEEVGVAAADVAVVVAVEGERRLGERREHPAVPSRQDLLVAPGPDALRPQTVAVALAARGDVALGFTLRLARSEERRV